MPIHEQVLDARVRQRIDYDYTLACYTSHLPELLYRLCKERLVHKQKVNSNLVW